MTATITPADWMAFLDAEYLETYIADGGASVKFAVPLDDSSRDAVLSELPRCAHAANYLVLGANAAVARVHMIDQLFYRLAEQVPWRKLSNQFLDHLAVSNNYRAPAPGPEPFVERLAAANDLGTDFLFGELRKLLQQTVFRDTSLAKDFRVAMTQLCLAELTAGDEGETTIRVITDWLTGVNKAVSAVKPYQIRSRINRTNARYLLESMLIWIRRGDFRGTVVVLDVDRVTLARNPKDGDVFYSRAALLDVYEVLRQFIDGTDRLEGCLLVVVPGAGFIDTEKGTRHGRLRGADVPGDR